MGWQMLLGFFFALLDSTFGYPIDPAIVIPGSGFGIAILGTVFLIAAAVFLLGCACCRTQRTGFKEKDEELGPPQEFRNSTASLSHPGFTNALSELAIFPPPGAEVTLPSSPSPTPPQEATKPAAFTSAVPSILDWFGDPNLNFPRQQLFYKREIGQGWFGKVVEGEARGAKVIVRILREDASPQEKAYFLHEAKPFRDLRHRNVSRLYGRCLEHEPFLLLFDMCTNGDLKSFLVSNASSKPALNEQGLTLRMMTDVAEGLNYMIENGFIHTDLAARNCLVGADLTVKIGDYGTSIDTYKNEYYISDRVAIPVRWCAPETLHCTPTTIEARQMTEAANVWSLAVTLWEIAEFGKLPYDGLTDDQVIVKVFGSEKLRLAQPDCICGHYLYNIMQLCWRNSDRANMAQVLSMLHYLRSNPIQELDFEVRWKNLKPNSIARVDNHTPMHSPRHTELAQRPRLPAKAEFDSGVDLEMKTPDLESCKSTTPTTVSPQLSVTSDEFLQKKSPSLTNLHEGSFDDVRQYDSWLQGVEQNTEEDRTFVKNVSEAIKNLDEALAMEKTSSSSQEDSEEDRTFVKNVSEAIKNLDEALALEKTSTSSQEDSLEGVSKPLVPEFRLGPLEGGESSSDTEDETWRHRIERGEFSEKVKEKSKSVTDLMVLTHIDSEGSETDSLPSLTRQLSIKKNGSKPTFTNIGFGSEGNIRNAVLGEELQDKLKQLSLWKTDEPSSFLGKAASEINKRNDKTRNGWRMKPRGDRAPLSLPVNSNNVNTPSLALTQNIELQCTSNKEEVDIQNSSQELSNYSVPEIIITESKVMAVDSEPDTTVDTGFLCQIKPRKFVFVCRDLEWNESDDGVDESQRSETEGESSVILGSCEDYTLDYFKGLKTTFVPPENLSDEECELPDRPDLEESIRSPEEFAEGEPEGIKELCDACELYPSRPGLPNGLDYSEGDRSGTNGSIDSTSPLSSSETESNQTVIETLSKLNDRLITDLAPLHKESGQPLYTSPNLGDIVESFIAAERCNPEVYYIDDVAEGQPEMIGPVFKMNGVVSERPLSTESGSFSSVYSSDSGHCSERGSNQDKQMNDLKIRLEDMVKQVEEYHLKRTEDEYGGKLLTPDDERSSDSGFRDKGSLSESAEDTCDEKYNLEDIDAELDDYANKTFEVEVGDSGDSEQEPNSKLDGWYLHPPKQFDEPDSGWISESTADDDVYDRLAVDDQFISALRKELAEKLPQAVQGTSGVQDEEEEAEVSPEPERPEIACFSYPSQLSPIIEEQESSHSSLVLEASPVFSLPAAPIQPPDTFREDIIKALDYSQSPSQNSLIVSDLELGSEEIYNGDRFCVEDDVLVVDTETNEATIIESPKPHSHLAFVNNTKTVEGMDATYLISSSDSSDAEDVPNLPISPDLSLSSGTVSSPQEGRMSGVFLSPSSVRSDLFDSGPPSLPFDFGQSTEEVEEVPIERPHNEAAEIELQLLQAGVFSHSDNDTDVSTPGSSNFDYMADELTPVAMSPAASSTVHSSGALSGPSSLDSACLEEPRPDVISSGPSSPTVIRADNKLGTGGAVKAEDYSSALPPAVDCEKSDNIISVSENSLVPVHGISETSCSHQEAVNHIDQLLSENSLSTETVVEKSMENGASEDVAPENGEQTKWLKDLLALDSTLNKPGNEVLPSDIKLFDKDWPSVDELIPAVKDDKKAEETLLGAKLSSTLALMSPDVMSASASALSLSPLSPVDPPVDQKPNRPEAVRVDRFRVFKVEALTEGGELPSPTSNTQGVPLPSPEDADRGWRPTISQLMELSEQQTDAEEMTTSFIEPDENGTYTPEWDSDTDEQSSSSGEFIWKEGDKEDSVKPLVLSSDPSSPQDNPTMESIKEEDEEEDSDSSDGSVDSSSEGSTSEFIPSTWDSNATPSKSALKTPSSDKSSKKKKVIFKKEKYQCIYEYPREPSDDEDEEQSSWKTNQGLFDYSLFTASICTDWELGEAEFPVTVEGDSDTDDSKSAKKQDFDFYRLDYNLGSSYAMDDGEFFISKGGDLGSSSEFFPGMKIDIDSDEEFSPSASDLTPLKEPDGPLGALRHTKDQLKLDLKPVRPEKGEASILDSGIDTCST